MVSIQTAHVVEVTEGNAPVLYLLDTPENILLQSFKVRRAEPSHRIPPDGRIPMRTRDNTRLLQKKLALAPSSASPETSHETYPIDSASSLSIVTIAAI